MSKPRNATKPASASPAAMPASAKQDYRVLVTGWVAGRRAEEGDILRLTETEARYEAVEPVKDVDAE